MDQLIDVDEELPGTSRFVPVEGIPACFLENVQPKRRSLQDVLASETPSKSPAGQEASPPPPLEAPPPSNDRKLSPTAASPVATEKPSFSTSMEPTMPAKPNFSPSMEPSVPEDPRTDSELPEDPPMDLDLDLQLEPESELEPRLLEDTAPSSFVAMEPPPASHSFSPSMEPSPPEHSGLSSTDPADQPPRFSPSMERSLPTVPERSSLAMLMEAKLPALAGDNEYSTDEPAATPPPAPGFRRRRDDDELLRERAYLEKELEAEREQRARASRELETARARYDAQRSECRELHELSGRLRAELELARRREEAALEASRDAEARAATADDDAAKLHAEVSVWRREHAAVSAELADARRELAVLRQRRPRDDEPPPRQQRFPREDERPVRASLAELSRPRWSAEPGGFDEQPRQTADVRDEDHRPLRPRNNDRSLTAYTAPKHNRRSSSIVPRQNNQPPFATEDDLEVISRREPLERDLLKLNVERDRLLAEYARIPEAARTQAQRDRRNLTEARIRQLDTEAKLLKSRIRATSSST